MSSPEEARAAGGEPEPELPPEWEADEERMAFLFSAFKQSRDVNATDWDSKMRFWAALVLARGRRRGGGVRTSLRQLQRAFERRGSVPLGLGTVLRELLRYRPAGRPPSRASERVQSALPARPPAGGRGGLRAGGSPAGRGHRPPACCPH